MRSSPQPRGWVVLAMMMLGMGGTSASCQRSSALAPAPAPAATAVPPAAPATAPAAPPPGTTAPAFAVNAGSAAAATGPSRVKVELTEQGFVPDHIPAQVGKPITLVITRKTDKTCAREILFKGQPGKTELPLGKEVEATFTPKASGPVPFGCAMGMMVGGVLDAH